MSARELVLAPQGLYRGQSIRFYIDNPVDEDGVAITLASWTWRMTIKAAITDADPGVAQVSSPSSGITFTTTTRVQVLVSGTVTAAFTAGQTYHWDLWTTNIATPTITEPQLYGTFAVIEGVTDTHP